MEATTVGAFDTLFHLPAAATTKQALAAARRESTRSLLTDVDEAIVRLPLRSSVLRIRIHGIEPRWLYPALAAFQQLIDLPAGWDSYDAQPITERAITAATRAMADYVPTNAPPPSVVPGSSGSVQLEWHHGGADVEMHVSPDGDVTAFIADGTDESEFDYITADAEKQLARVLGRMSA